MRVDESFFLRPMFAALNSAGVKYAVMRNYEALPKSLNGSDLDLIVERGSIDDAKKVILRVANECGGQLIGEIVSPWFCELAMLGKFNDAWWGVEIDLCDGGYVWEPIDGDEVLSRKILSDSGVWVLSPDCARLLGCAKELLMNRSLPAKYLVDAKKFFRNKWHTLFLDRKFACFVAKCILKGEPPSVSSWICMRLWLVMKGLKSRFVAQMNGYLGYYFSKVLRIVRPCGRMIAILGTDGAGKSTLIELISRALNLTFHKSIVVHHLKPDLLPPLSRFRGVKDIKPHVCSSPHASSQSGVIGSLGRISYLVSDYIFGYYLKVRINLARLPVSLWIFDRYAYDMLIDPRRFRIKLPQWIIRIFLFFVPRPDLILCLGGDPDKIFARKPETSFEEVKRQVAAIKKFCAGNKRAVWIDTTKSIEDSTNVALTAILERLARRCD